MGFELERVLVETEDFLIRKLRSSSAREAKKRRFQKTVNEVVRRLKRSAVVLVAMLGGLVLWSLLVGPIAFMTWLIAIPTAFLVAFVTLFYPSRRRAEPPLADSAATARLDELALRAANGLIDRCEELPGRAIPAAEAIVARLRELAPHLGTLDPRSLETGDARRLICQHLPRLVDSYLALPASDRSAGSENSQRFTDSLGIVAGELDHLLEQCCRERRLGFETQRRFIESRYKEDQALRRP